MNWLMIVFEPGSSCAESDHCAGTNAPIRDLDYCIPSFH